MIPIRAYKGTRVAVFGLGRTGIATAKALTAGGAIVSAWDDDEATRARAEAEGVPLDNIYARDWGDCAGLVLSPGIPHTLPKPHKLAEIAKAINVPILNDITLLGEAFAQEPTAKVIGVTGSNGKSTTAALIAHILAGAGYDVQLGGNIGRAVLTLEPPKPGRIYVLELSSYQLELAANLHCDVAVMTNLSPDHLDRHGDMTGYIQAKANIFTGQGHDDVAVLALDESYSQSLYTQLRSQKHQDLRPVSAKRVLGDGISVLGGKLYDAAIGRSQTVLSLAGHSALEGRHNAQNVGLAYAAARAVGLTIETIREGVQSFKGLTHRQERLSPIERVAFINDSKATNAAASSQALKRFSDIYWILGGQSKGDGVASLVDQLSAVKAIYVYGQDSRRLIRQLGVDHTIIQCRTLDEATQRAFDDARGSSFQNPHVVLSPACASFDQFANFEARGDHFKACVEQLRQAYNAGLQEQAS